MNKVALVLFSVIVLSVEVKCAKILGVFPAPGYSQYILCEVLMKELANRGHEVTVISAYSPKIEISNYTTIKTDDIIATTDSFNLFEIENYSVFANIIGIYDLGYLITESTLKHEKVQDLLHSDETFDLVIVEEFLNDALKGFATHFNAPLVLLSSMGLVEWNQHFMGYPPLPSINALCFSSHTNQMTFLQRLENLIAFIFDSCYRNLVAFYKHQDYLTKYFPKPMDLNHIMYNASLMLLNSHTTTSENVLLPYNMVEVGGFHITQNPLDQNIQKLLNTAKDGVILFSMGSNLRSSDLTEETLEIFFSVFRKLKQKVLWKFEKQLPNKPENVFISKWLNQSDILSHPNVKLFITHGGLLGTTEAIFYGVPMVGIPIYGDQRMNMARATRHGIATVISFQQISTETFYAAINETIYNPTYYIKAKQMSELIKDRPIKPLDLAVYWIEYSIRHRGVRFDLPTLHLRWFQFYMIDIIAAVIILLWILLKLFFKICKVFTRQKPLEAKLKQG